MSAISTILTLERSFRITFEKSNLRWKWGNWKLETPVKRTSTKDTQFLKIQVRKGNKILKQEWLRHWISSSIIELLKSWQLVTTNNEIGINQIDDLVWRRWALFVWDFFENKIGKFSEQHISTRKKEINLWVQFPPSSTESTYLHHLHVCEINEKCMIER